MGALGKRGESLGVDEGEEVRGRQLCFLAKKAKSSRFNSGGWQGAAWRDWLRDWREVVQRSE